MNRNELVDDGIIIRAFANWLKASEANPYVQIVQEFYKLTGINTFLLTEYLLEPSKAALVKSMASVHGYSICRAIMVRKNYELSV